MWILLLTLIIGLSSCVVQIEEAPSVKKTPVRESYTKKKKGKEKVRKEKKYRAKKEIKESKLRKPGREVEYLSPLKGKARKEGRGFFISSSCKKFFRAVEGGKAVYVGKDLKAYGWTVIVEQKDGFIGVYTRTGELFIREGERVRKRQVLGRVGRKKGKCGIYFEVRDRKGKPVRVRLR